MTTGTLTRADLTESVFQAVGLSRTDSAQMVEDMLRHVKLDRDFAYGAERVRRLVRIGKSR